MGRRAYDRNQGTLFPGLVDRIRYQGSFGPMDPASLAQEKADREWWSEWNKAHPAPRSCICGLPGGTVWLTFLDHRGGPRPCHPSCVTPAQRLRNG